MGERFSFGSTTRTMPNETAAVASRRFLTRVYNWMCGGLAATGLVAWFVGQSPELVRAIVSNPILFWGLMIGELGMVIYLSARIEKMTAQTAKSVFLAYAVLNGVTFSVIFLAYSRSSIGTAFLVTSGMFGAMSFYGATTKKSLASWGSFFFMGLVGIVIASVVNIFLQSSAVYWISTYIGVLVFTGLTAYDTQKILQMNVLGSEGTELETKGAISGALTLYLDFINLFLMMLRILGGNRK